MAEELLERYQCDRDRRAYERLVETHRPLVRSVCLRWLRDPDDVDDAVQETFLKLAGHINRLNGSVAAWLTATAQATSVDLIRRSVRQRNRRRALARVGAQQAEHPAVREAIRLRLRDAMGAIEPAARTVLTERFIRGTPLRILATQLDTSVPTASRHVARAVRQLAEVLRDMGVSPADDRAVAGHLGDTSAADDPDESDHGGLRFAPDWRCAELTPLGVTPAPMLLAGWSRPIRVGALLSYDSTLIIAANGRRMGIWQQIQSTAVFPSDGFQRVGVVEPSSVHRGIVECGLRDYAITGGLIEADDAAALATLDVLLLGINFTMSPPIARAINQAVRNGMGLLSEYWTASQCGSADDPSILELMLADGINYKYHMPGQCGPPLPATVLLEHPLLPGLKPGTKMSVRGCGPAYRVVPGAQTIIAKDHVVPPEEHGVREAGPLPMPCYIVGQLGRGRVVVNHVWPARGPGVVPHDAYDISQHLNISRDEYFLNLLCWLARSRNDVG